MSIRKDFWQAQQHAPRDEWVIQLIGWWVEENSKEMALENGSRVMIDF